MGNQKLNKHSREQRRAAERDELLGNGPRRGSDSRSRIDDEWHTLNAQIGALETFITGAAKRADQQRRQKLMNILPPPDRADYPRDRPDQRLSRWQQRNLYETRQRHGLSFFFLFAAVCLLLWWLLNGASPL